MNGPYTIKKPEQEWQGLTLDEIRYARALTQTRILISREILTARASDTFKGTSGETGNRTLMGRMLGALSWLDYGVIALRVGSKLSGLLRRNKKR